MRRNRNKIWEESMVEWKWDFHDSYNHILTL